MAASKCQTKSHRYDSSVSQSLSKRRGFRFEEEKETAGMFKPMKTSLMAVAMAAHVVGVAV